MDPSSGRECPDAYAISSWAEIEEAVRAGYAAAATMAALSPDALADFLDDYARGIEANAEDIIRSAHAETALPIEPRLRSVELPQAAFQLRQAGAAARDRSWCRATIDTKADIRSKYGPLGGPVVVFGPNNFPFACNSAAGTDFASAIAAGNPVIAKAHPGHPGTTRLFAEIAFDCLRRSSLPASAVQLIYHMRAEDGLSLVSHPLVGASAFTGSRPGGLRLKEAADKAGKPIYLEMSSINPIFILPGALGERSEAMAAESFGSCTLGAGQFCTKPGLLVLPGGEAAEAFFNLLKRMFVNSPAYILLGPGVSDALTAAIGRLVAAGAELNVGGRRAEGPGFRFAATLLKVSGAGFLKNPRELQQEAFGPLTLCVMAENAERLIEIAAAFEGNLTAALYSRSGLEDEPLAAKLGAVLRFRCGRLLNDKVPTGVAVSSAMVHGGPFPASGHPGFTAVGAPASLTRFAALHGYDHVRPHRLPPELRNENPNGCMWRLVDGEWTKR